MTTVIFPLSTGQVAKLIGCSEFNLSNQARLNKVAPPLICGRRAWYANHVLHVARILGRDTIEIRHVCDNAIAAAKIHA